MREEIKNWWEHAKKDLDSAEKNFAIKDYHLTAFLCHQQAVEKGLKTLLIKKKGQFPKVHDLVDLSKLLNAPRRIIINCGKINPSYTETRYPDSLRDYSKQDAKDILKWIEKNL